jgi:hypothetical protein
MDLECSGSSSFCSGYLPSPPPLDLIRIELEDGGLVMHMPDVKIILEVGEQIIEAIHPLLINGVCQKVWQKGDMDGLPKERSKKLLTQLGGTTELVVSGAKDGQELPWNSPVTAAKTVFRCRHARLSITEGAYHKLDLLLNWILSTSRALCLHDEAPSWMTAAILYYVGVNGGGQQQVLVLGQAVMVAPQGTSTFSVKPSFQSVCVTTTYGNVWWSS